MVQEESSYFCWYWHLLQTLIQRWEKHIKTSLLTKLLPCQGLQKTYLFAYNVSNLSHPLLFPLLSVEVKHGKVAKLECKQNNRGTRHSYHRGLKVRWLSENLSPTTPSDLYRWLPTENNELTLKDNGSVCSGAAECSSYSSLKSFI